MMTAERNSPQRRALERETRQTQDEIALWRDRLDKALFALRREIEHVQGIIDERDD